MAGKTVTRADLCEAVYQKVGLSRTESATLVELVLKEITDCLERGETVKLSSFGSFVVRKKGQRILKDEGIKFVQAVWKSGAPQPARLSGEAEESGAGLESLSADSGLPEEETGRGRGFFGILPSLLGGDIEGPAVDRHASRVEPLTADVDEPPLAPGGESSAAQVTASAEGRHEPINPGSLASDERRALRATLFELDECKRLLDGALGEE